MLPLDTVYKNTSWGNGKILNNINLIPFQNMVKPLPTKQKTSIDNFNVTQSQHNARLSLVPPIFLFVEQKTNEPAKKYSAKSHSSPESKNTPVKTSVHNKTAKTSESESMVVKGLPVTIQWDKRYTNSTKRVPDGYEQIKNNLPKGLSEVASTILKKGNPIGTYTPFVLDGKEYLAINEYHTHYASRPNDPPGKIYAITVFKKI